MDWTEEELAQQERWKPYDIDDAATLLGLPRNTSRNYSGHGVYGKPDGRTTGHPWWYRETLLARRAARPGKGARTDLQR